jgi:putative Holliday junction resolvase
MAVVDLFELPMALSGGQRLAGVDHGQRTIGLAISDTLLMIATPAMTLQKSKFTRDAQVLFGWMAEREVAGLVVGLPVNMDGSEGPRSQSVRAFVRHLMRLKDVPAAFWDERLSTAAVNRAMIEEADLSRARRAARVDRAAAAWILQGALDRLRAAPPDPTTAL